MGVASGCGEQEVGVASGSGWNLWVWLLGVVLRRYIDFLILLIPYSSCICTFLQQHPYFFFHFVKMILHSLQLGLFHNCHPYFEHCTHTS